MHADLVYMLRNGDLWLRDPELAGVRLAYPWTAHVYQAVLSFLIDSPPTSSYIWTNTVWLLCFFGFSYYIVGELTNSSPLSNYVVYLVMSRTQLYRIHRNDVCGTTRNGRTLLDRRRLSIHTLGTKVLFFRTSNFRTWECLPRSFTSPSKNGIGSTGQLIFLSSGRCLRHRIYLPDTDRPAAFVVAAKAGATHHREG